MGGPHHPSCVCVGAQMVRMRRQVQLLFQTLTVPSADAEATRTDAEYSPWLALRPKPSLLPGLLVEMLPSAADAGDAPVAAKGSGLMLLEATAGQ